MSMFRDCVFDSSPFPVADLGKATWIGGPVTGFRGRAIGPATGETVTIVAETPTGVWVKFFGGYFGETRRENVKRLEAR